MNFNIHDLDLYKDPETKKAICNYYLEEINKHLDLLLKLFYTSSEEDKVKNITVLNQKVLDLEKYNG